MQVNASAGRTVKQQILMSATRRGPGKPFLAKDFLDIGSRASVDMALGSLAKEGTIRRIRRGLYDIPKVSSTLGGELSPDIDAAAHALARRYRWKIVPDGPWAANLLGLSTQVPAKITYLSDGPSRSVPIGRRTIQFKHARPQALAAHGGKAALVIQALRHIGKEAVNDENLIAMLKSILSAAEVNQFVKAAHLGVDWIYEVAKLIAKDQVG
jgi:hypothetical protein